MFDFIISNKDYMQDFITRSTYHSNAIEGSTLTYAETYAIIYNDNKTKEEEIISLDALIYYLDEKLNTGAYDVTEDEIYSWEEHEENCDGDCGESCHCGHHHE